MKTTVELDDKRLVDVMRLANLKTRKAALDYALVETEKMLRLRNLAARSFYDAAGAVIDKRYDLKKIRSREK